MPLVQDFKFSCDYLCVLSFTSSFHFEWPLKMKGIWTFGNNCIISRSTSTITIT